MFFGTSITVKRIIKQVLSMERREKEEEKTPKQLRTNGKKNESRFEALLKASEQRERSA